MNIEEINNAKLLEIVTYPNPILKKIAEPVTEFNEELKTLCFNMIHTMYQAPGIGLAAPQVGVSKRIFVMDIGFERETVENMDGTETHTYSNQNPIILINPIISDKKGEYVYEEGCLSLPGIYDNVKRAKEITVTYQDFDGNEHTLQAEDLLAVCIQHENDHLEGVVFIERLSLLKKNLFHKKLVKRKKVYG